MSVIFKVACLWNAGLVLAVAARVLSPRTRWVAIDLPHRSQVVNIQLPIFVFWGLLVVGFLASTPWLYRALLHDFGFR